jgi:nitroreductase
MSEESLRFLRRLRAIREFTAEPVDEATIRQILEVARWSASGGNRQPWQVVVIRDPAVKQKLGDWGAKPAASAAVVFLIVMESQQASLDEGRLAERLCLATAASGLGSVVATLKNEGPDEVKKLLGIPSERRAVALVAAGHIDREARKALPANPRAGRKPMEEFAMWERF